MDKEAPYSPLELTRMKLQADEADRLGFHATALAMRKVVRMMSTSRALEKNLKSKKAA